MMMKRFLILTNKSVNHTLLRSLPTTTTTTATAASTSTNLIHRQNQHQHFLKHENCQQTAKATNYRSYHSLMSLMQQAQEPQTGEEVMKNSGETPAKKRATKKSSSTTAATATRKKSKKSTSTDELAENEREVSDDELFEHKWHIQNRVKQLLTQESYSHAYPMLHEWYNFVHRPMSKRPDVLEELYRHDLRHVLSDALLFGFLAQCHCVYDDVEQAKKSKPFFRKSFELFDQYFARIAKNRQELQEKQEAQQAQELQYENFMSSEQEQAMLNRTRGVLYTYAGFLWLKTDTYTTAEKYLLRAAAEDRDSVFIFHRLAHYNRDRGDFVRAGKFYELAIQRLNNATLIGEYGSFLFSYPRNYKKAVEMFERALKLNPTHPDVLIAYASYYIQMENFEKAIEMLLRALHEKNTDPRPASMLGTVYVLMSQYDKARQSFIQARSLGGYMNYKQTSHYAIAEYQCGNVNEAKSLFEQAMKMHDSERASRQSAGEPADDVIMLVRYAQLLFDSFKKYTDARLLLERAMAADPTYPDAHFLYALLMTKLQEFKKADEHYEILISVEPNGDFVKGVLLKTHLSWYIDYLIGDKKEPESAGPHIKRLMKLIQDFPNENQDSDILEDLEEHKTAYPHLF